MTTLTISLPPETAARLEREAQARGVSAETVAAEAVEAWTAFDDEGWDEGPESESENVPLDVAFDALDARIAAKHPGAR
jgi:predicted transcriptional regulator